MEMYQSSKGEILSKYEWELELNKFWGIFEGSKSDKDLSSKLPQRPTNAWERFVKVLGLVRI
jgi:hypothetical protein